MSNHSSANNFYRPIMISWHGNVFHNTGPLWGESTCYGGFPSQRASKVGLWCLLCCYDMVLNKELSIHLFETTCHTSYVTIIHKQIHHKNFPTLYSKVGGLVQDVTTLLTQWRYVFLALTHQSHVLSNFCKELSNIEKNLKTFHLHEHEFQLQSPGILIIYSGHCHHKTL